jgi:hypothetical protein
MGNYICRYILPPSTGREAVARISLHLRQTYRTPTVLHRRDLQGRNVRNPLFKILFDANIVLVDVEGRLKPDDLIDAGTKVFGGRAFLLRHADDDELDVTYPNAEWLKEAYGNVRLEQLLDPEEAPIPWNTETWYAYPRNPPEWDCSVPIMAALLQVARPGDPRECPICATTYTSKGDRGQCPSCGFVSWPFKSAAEATQFAAVPLDAFKWGHCPRCRLPKELSHVIEQCTRCGQLLRGDGSKHKIGLIDNEGFVRSLLRSG